MNSSLEPAPSKIVGICSDPGQVALVRAEAERRGLSVFIDNEFSSAMLGPLVGSPPLRVRVAAIDAEAGYALMRELFSGAAPSRRAYAPQQAIVGDVADDHVGDVTWDASDSTDSVRMTLAFRRRVIGTVLIGAIVPFGVAHASVGAWRRSAALFVAIYLTLRYRNDAWPLDFGLMWMSLVLLDMGGALWLLQRKRQGDVRLLGPAVAVPGRAPACAGPEAGTGAGTGAGGGGPTSDSWRGN